MQKIIIAVVSAAVVISVGVGVVIYGSLNWWNGKGGEKTHEHVWGAWVETTNADCTHAGVKTRVCEIDATHKETMTGTAALGHARVEEVVKAASESENGKEVTLCGRAGCDLYENETVLWALGSVGLSYDLVEDDAEMGTYYEVKATNYSSLVGQNIWIPAYHKNEGEYIPVKAVKEQGFMGTYAQNGILEVKFCEGDQMEVFETGAFQDNKDIKMLAFPESLKRIEQNAFTRCLSANRTTTEAPHTYAPFVIPASVEYVGMAVFGQCDSTPVHVLGHANKQSTLEAGWYDDWTAALMGTITYLG